MANLAIRGHKTRGKEVIEILGILGGSNAFGHIGNNPRAIYYIDENYKNFIICSETKKVRDCIIFTLEEFLEKFPYKIGDKVKDVRINDSIGIITNVRWDDNEEQIIYVVEWDDAIKSTLNYFARGLQPYKEEAMETITIDDFKANTKEWLIDKLHGMIISDAIKTIGNIHDELHKPKYPKIYEECCEIMGIESWNTLWGEDSTLYEEQTEDLINAFIRLKVCRDAYWKIAGEQMGLGKPWKPDWDNENEYKYGLFRLRNIIYKDATCINPTLLIFPTAEIRDAFYENFKDLIETCKELL